MHTGTSIPAALPGPEIAPVGPNLLRRFDLFASRLCIEPLWAGFSVTPRAGVCDARYGFM